MRNRYQTNPKEIDHVIKTFVRRTKLRIGMMNQHELIAGPLGKIAHAYCQGHRERERAKSAHLYAEYRGYSTEGRYFWIFSLENSVVNLDNTLARVRLQTMGGEVAQPPNSHTLRHLDWQL